MKRLILPLIVALLAGLGGGTGYAIMSIAPAPASAAPHDSTAAGDSTGAHTDSAGAVAPDTAGQPLHPADLPAGAASRGPALAPTPADSIRAEQAARAGIKSEATAARATTSGASAPAPNATSGKPVSAKEPAPRGVAGPVAALSAALPEQRLAKIFGAMQAKDAGKVLEQMTDSDIRTVLGMMSDRQAAAILSTLSPQRAATITRGVVRGAGGTP